MILTVEIRNLTCEICFSDVDLNNIFIFSDCYHYYCLECLKTTLKIQIEEKNKLNKIKCPFDGCNSQITFNDVKFILYQTNEKKLFDKYDRYLLDIAVQSDKNIKFGCFYFFFFFAYFLFCIDVCFVALNVDC